MRAFIIPLVIILLYLLNNPSDYISVLYFILSFLGIYIVYKIIRKVF
jgi:hypothetical protein